MYSKVLGKGTTDSPPFKNSRERERERERESEKKIWDARALALVVARNSSAGCRAAINNSVVDYIEEAAALGAI